jgi:hypothetical protein
MSCLRNKEDTPKLKASDLGGDMRWSLVVANCGNITIGFVTQREPFAVCFLNFAP